jgi:hypothetical protein
MCCTNAFLHVLYLRYVWNRNQFQTMHRYFAHWINRVLFHKLILKTIIRNNCVHHYLTGWYEFTVHWNMMPRHVVCGNQPWHETAYPPNRLSPFIKLHGVRSQKTVIVILTTVIVSSLMQGNKLGRDSSVGIATQYGLDGPGIKSR